MPANPQDNLYCSQTAQHAVHAAMCGKTSMLVGRWQVFIDTDTEMLWLLISAPEELESLQGSKFQMDLSLIYPTDPTQLPPELAGKQWPPRG